MKKKNLLVLLAASTLLLAGCNPKKEDAPKDDPTPVEPGDDTVHVLSVTLSPKTLDLEVNGTGNLTATVLPTNATNPTVTWSSSNTAVATVANGVVTAVAAGSATITATADGKSDTCAVTVTNPVIPPEPIEHQDPFVSTVTDPSLTRNFREEFDVMVEDFSGATPSGETTGQFTDGFLRVLVDSEDENEPQSPDAAIYKMATGVHAIQNFEGIGFRMRAVGNRSINLSNLVLGLRGDDAYKVFPLKLSEAFNPDQEELPELTNRFQDIIISPQQSIDADTEYELAEGGASETKVLDKILGFHLYALDEECSAVIEIENVFLYEAGEKTILDNFNRAAVNKTDDSCWWRDSTGFIVQKGVTLKNTFYTTKAIELGDYKNIVINVLGDTSGLRINNVAYASLKDSEGKALTGAVNGAFYSYVINLEQSGIELAEGKLTFSTSTGVVISQIFLTNLVNEAPVTEYPLIDIPNASYLTKFEATKAAGSIKTNYVDAAADTETNTALDTNHVIAWAGTDLVSMDGHNLVLAKDENEGLVNLVIGSKAEVKDYLVIALRATDNPASLRFKLGTSEVINLANCVAGPGLPTVPANAVNYPYLLEDGFGLLVIDLERSGFAGVTNEINIFYNGDAKVEIDSIFFADAYKPEAIVKEKVLFEDTVADGSGYAYVAGIDVTGIRYLKIETTATSANELRFGFGGDAIYINSGNLKDIDGNTIADGSTEFILDIEASHIVLEGNQWFHVHSTAGETPFTMKISSYELMPAIEVTEIVKYNDTIAAGSGYAYVAGIDVTGFKFVKVETTATSANELRFGLGGDAVYINSGNLIGIDGKPIADGSQEFIIDLEASHIVLEDNKWFHVHSTAGEDSFTMEISLYDEKPTLSIKALADPHEETVLAGEGYSYVCAIDVTGANAVKVETTATSANELRFGLGGDAVYINSGNLKDPYGDTIADGSTEFIIDLSNIVLEGNQWFHVHSTAGLESFTITLTPVAAYVVGSYAFLLAAYAG